jgi:5-methylcytosine-specific restriction protein A
VTQKSLFINKQELAPKIINEEAFETKQYLDEKQAEKRSIAEIKERIKNAEAKPKTLDVQSTRYVRNPDVVVIAKINAKGKCQLCQKEAPFKDSKGKPFLEIHHIKWLAEGGDDKPENTVALCPNCHRKMHIRNLPEDRAFLFKRISTYKH